MGHVRRCFRLDELSSPENAREVVNVDLPPRPGHRFNRFFVNRGRHGLMWDSTSDDSEESSDGDNVLKALLKELPETSSSCGKGRSTGEKIREDLPPEIEVMIEFHLLCLCFHNTTVQYSLKFRSPLRLL